MNNAKFGLRTSRLAIVAALAMGLAGVVYAAAPATSRGPAATASRPAPTAANKQAANTQYLKAKELYDAGKFAEANAELEKALALDPTHGDAMLMKRVLEGKLTGTAATAGTGTTGPGGKPGALTPTQINLVKLGELTAADVNIRGRIDRAVLEEFWNEVYLKDPLAPDISKQAHDAFVSTANFPLQVRLIRDSKQQKYLEKITLTTDPAAIVAFRTGQTGAHNYAMQNCATSECHGGDKGGTFRLLPSAGAAPTPETLYTNFYIMSMYANGEGKMIDRDNPDKSLLLQYSLPWASTQLKHPKVEVKKIPNLQDARYRAILEWVKALNLPRPSYGITYEVPGGK